MADEQKIATMLMFTGQAEEAISFYTALFDDSRVEFIQHYGPDYPGPEGQVVHSRFKLKGQSFLAMDSHVEQASTFTPRISFFVTCADEAEIDRLFRRPDRGWRGHHGARQVTRSQTSTPGSRTASASPGS